MGRHGGRFGCEAHRVAGSAGSALVNAACVRSIVIAHDLACLRMVVRASVLRMICQAGNGRTGRFAKQHRRRGVPLERYGQQNSPQEECAKARHAAVAIEDQKIVKRKARCSLAAHSRM